MDNTELDGHNELLFDEVNGLYKIPADAVVTVMATNPAVKDFIFDGEYRNLASPARHIDFRLDNGDELIIGIEMLAGERTVIHFAGDDKELTFTYSATFSGTLSAQNLQQTGFVFADTAEYCYQFTIDGIDYTFAEIALVVFDKSVDIAVTKKARSAANFIALVLCYYEGMAIDVIVDKTIVELHDLPDITRAGYAFLGWSEIDNGAVFTDNDEFQTFIASADGHTNIYAVWNEEVVDYGGNTVIGTWRATLSNGENTLICTMVFNADGTYEYETKINGELSADLYGIYRVDEDGVITILSAVGGDGLIDPSDLVFVISENALIGNLIFIHGDAVTIAAQRLTR
jgi:hypothetical protein